MASRLALKYGLVSEEDRLPNSSDAIVVTEPTTGSKARTKGSLYLIVSSKSDRRPGARRVPARRRHDPARVLLRRVGGHLDRSREGRPRRQSSPAPVARGRQPGRLLDRLWPRRRARQRAVRGDRGRRQRLPDPLGPAAHARASLRTSGCPQRTTCAWACGAAISPSATRSCSRRATWSRSWAPKS